LARPATTLRRPASIAATPIRATRAPSIIARRRKPRISCPETAKNSVAVGPGESTVTVTPLARSSWARASPKWRTKLLAAA